MIREEIEKLLQKALKELGFKIEKISLEHPEHAEHGDYATSVAFVLAKQAKKNPKEVADLIVSKIDIKKIKFLDKIEAVGGFVNFFISKEYLVKELSRVSKEKEKYGLSSKDKGKKVMIEFCDPNPFKEFHIGHVYSNIVGESLSKLFESQGATVKRANYQGDVGMHVAKTIWGLENIDVKKLEKKELAERIKILGEAYTKGDKAFEEDEKAKKEITELNTKIFALDKDIKEIYEKGRKWSLEYFETMYKRLGMKFDYYYFERDAAKVGEKIVQEYVKKGVFQESQGAIVFPGEKHGLHSRVFINSKGLPTYEAKELGLAPTKYKDFKYDLSVIVTGNEIIEYFKVLIAALKEVNPELGEKTIHLSHGMVRLQEGKMSSRTGNIITGEELLDEIKKRVAKLNADEKTAEIVALGAVKYSLLRVGLGKDIIFDFEKSLNTEGESGPYLQYTYARCKSILRKAQSMKYETRDMKQYDFSAEELTVLRLLYRFPEVVQEAAEKFAPSIICNYVFDVAQAYNHFYNTTPVLKAETKEKCTFRLLLTASTAQVIQNSLKLLGIQTLEKM